MIEQMPSWRGKCDRGTVEQNLLEQPWGSFLFRSCSDPTELINGQNNPNLFVLCYFVPIEPHSSPSTDNVACTPGLFVVHVWVRQLTISPFFRQCRRGDS